MKNTAAFLFDMDGTIADNMHYHLQAWEKAVDEAGSDLKGKELMEQLYGKNAEVVERIFGEGKKSEEEVEKISQRKEKYYHEFYGAHVKLIPGFKDFLTEAHKQGIKLAIATAGLKVNVDFVFDHTDIRELFDIVVSDENVKTSKPDPETFTLAANQLNISPAQCIVFEDSTKGVEGAQHAGMKAVAILTGKKEKDFAPFPNVIKSVSDYTSLSVYELLDAIGHTQEQEK